jgi:hypothetical protein
MALLSSARRTPNISALAHETPPLIRNPRDAKQSNGARMPDQADENKAECSCDTHQQELCAQDATAQFLVE